MELSVIIVNYNGMKYLKGCFDSLYDKLSGINFEIIVLDNMSADGSCEYIKQHYPEVRLIESSQNLGFGRGNNTAVEVAKGEYLLLINNDTIVQDHLAPALDFVQKDNTIGALGIRMLDGNGNYLISAANFPNPFNMVRLKNMFLMGPEFRSGNFTKAFYDVDWLGGSFLLMPKKIYDNVGGFDQDYFMYGEDVDLCKKVADAGYRRVFMPGLSYIHFVGYNNSRDNLVVKGHEMYIEKHKSGIDKMLTTAALSINKMIKKVKKVIGL
ncbi:glycosyltransferase family 2 protein [Flavobacterium sp. MFBS3-15]|uniref:glycosyltransferase family 2 protein n=1 Tax=Flavobacterium sp. MFBS3-15 TaxID=2989816 RepID=UPI00223554FA|nr:glycosyltransferase family 2 protein [Flavobacterium sp. MFBS3-15]MCW4469154.1 glycosyltransferase family 2 protein [Flavobacterium sp. MFBS3-15]